MSYNHYRTSAPGSWGTSNYRFGQPPEPHFRPQSSWSGLDYYQAHAMNPDPSLYHRVREGQYDTEGAAPQEAKHWHQQAYGGFGDIRSLAPREMGHAAAYEAYRIWAHNRFLSEMRSDYGQRREAFVALAIAEVSHIFPIGQVSHERRKMREACETAAATASTIFHTLGDDGYSGGGRVSHSPFRRPGSSSSDELDDDPFDDRALPHRSRSHRRRSSSVSFNSRPTIIPPGGSPYQHVSSIPIPVNNFGGGSPYHPGGSPYAGSSSPYLTTTGYPQQYPGGGQGLPLVGSPYDPNQGVIYQGAGSFPQQTYIQGQPGMPQSLPMVPGSSIVIQQPSQHSPRHGSSKRHHKHRSGSRRRSHSDADYGLHY